MVQSESNPVAPELNEPKTLLWTVSKTLGHLEAGQENLTVRLSELKTDLKSEIAEVKTDLKKDKKWLIATFVSVATLIVAAASLLVGLRG